MSQAYDFAIFTDSSADLGEDLVREMDIQVLPLSFTIQDRTYHNYPDNHELSPHTFYKMLRDGQTATTAAVNVEQYLQAMEPQLQAGRDVLVLAFSSGLSATCHSAQIAAQELSEQYPERKVYVVDSLCASLGQGLLVWYAARMKNEGRGIGAVRDWLEENKLHLCHWFTVDDLHFLKRGGRISSATAVLGTMLSIKPIITFSDDGQLQSIAKVRGRRQVQDKILELLRARFQSGRRYNLAVANGGAPEEMAEFAARLKAEFPNYEHFWEGVMDATLSVYIGDGVIGGGIQFLD